MGFSDFKQMARREFVCTARAYFLPLTFVWLLCVRGWPAAARHAVASFDGKGEP